VIERRAFVAGLSAVLAAPLSTQAQTSGRVWRIGLLDYAADPASGSRWKALRDRLRELGYVESQNVLFESRWSDGQKSRLPGVAAELVNAKVDIIVTAGSEAAAAVKHATSSIPVVLATGGDLVAMGIVPSLARPGGNVTGVISMTSELGGKRLELLRQLIPRVSRVAILRDPNNRGSRALVSEADRAAKSLGLVLQIVAVHGQKDLAGAFLTAKRAGADAVMFAENTAYIPHRQHVADLAITHRLPTMAPAKEYALAGVLVSYGTDYSDLFRRAAVHVDKILKGAKPGDMPIEQPTTFELVINLKTAQALGLTIPPSLLARADQMIE
jgi:putative tryptophan/tyrosine transport system substrate-binding protein